MAYHLEGDLLEVCTCDILCPCWVGENPDGGTCDSSLAYHIRSGEIDGVDVSGVTVAGATFIPGNVLDGNWRAIVYLDEEATPEQEAAMRRVFLGEAGGPIADLAQLVSEVIDVRRAAIVCAVEEGKGRFEIGEIVQANLEPFTGPNGEPTKLVESVFSTIPGSPAYVGKAIRYRQKSPELDQDIDIAGHNAISGPFVFDYDEKAAAA